MSSAMAFVASPPPAAPAQGLMKMGSQTSAALRGAVPLAAGQTLELQNATGSTSPTFLPAAVAVAGGAFAAAAAAGSRRRNRRAAALRRRRGGRASLVPMADGSEIDSESVLELAKKANVKLEVKPWQFLSGIAKEASRGWFVKRAEERGIRWSQLVKEEETAQPELDRLYDKLLNPNLEYPDYYTQPFHGYDEGNLSWKAAHELVPATQSMCLSYYDGLSWEEAQEKFRSTARNTFADAWRERKGTELPKNLLDMGCSCGFSTADMVRAFPGVSATGLDLSPYFLAAAKRQYPELDFVHRLAEETEFAANSFDVVTINFLLHEVPLETSQKILAECHRILKPGGMLAILDVDPKRLLELPPMRRWAFQVTEPWCKEGEYYSLKLINEFKNAGFEGGAMKKNDPVNTCAVAFKPE
mmetsp:Transcript_62156/g.148274  ORF Transcript_62156/g.148274 Transcript_62156/m.148274 type:complete len:415 (+) Transcript_62156:161-1405(+)|eukprot:CAMPEP_0178420700 /NCGR_PEP_ID=MMETSP0689_2-20121128/26267_1 /TAXON_ID=160604 /ORGANISM="Amphidinium massartii, Strain CS-259" /LENGTH=414 /DNA_ID=CAMNT_0020042189 /DNA_START=139 /DNA_END=1383 /DNA_ORIENTATION=+